MTGDRMVCERCRQPSSALYGVMCCPRCQAAVRGEGAKPRHCFEHAPNPRRRHWWQFWIPEYITIRKELI